MGALAAIFLFYTLTAQPVTPLRLGECYEREKFDPHFFSALAAIFLFYTLAYLPGSSRYNIVLNAKLLEN